MTVTTTYPGVYIREIPSGSRTITGVATSITAFVGPASRGPVDEPIAIAGFGDFERTFGGLWRESGLGYAVRDFYLNGGGEALIVRVVHGADDPDDDEDVTSASATVDVDGLMVSASGPGAWANVMEVEVTHPIGGDAADIANAQGVTPDDLFNLVVREGSGVDSPTETYLNVTTVDGPRRLDLVLAGSTLVRVSTPLGDARPSDGRYAVAGLDAGGLWLVAADLTIWAEGIEAVVTHPTGAAAEAAAAEQGVDVSDLFTIVLSTDNVADETHEFITVVDGTRRADLALAGSALGRAGSPLPAERPAVGTYEIGARTIGVDGDVPTAVDYVGSEDAKTGMHALLKADLFNLLCIPPPTLATDLDDSVWSAAAGFCTARRAFLIVDPPAGESAITVPTWVTGAGALTGSTMRNAAVYFPRIHRPDPLRGGATTTFAACGAIAGTYARTDGSRGVWKAPAGTDAGLAGVVGLSVSLTDAENGRLNPVGINCLRTFRGIGSVVWGARTLRGSDLLADEYKYVPVRRLALYLEETLYRNTQWVVFEPNDEPLWAQIRASIGAFMQDLFRKGAFQGISPRDAYFVRCDKDTTTQYDIGRGIVNVVVGFAPLKPAEFVVIGIQQKTASATA